MERIIYLHGLYKVLKILNMLMLSKPGEIDIRSYVNFNALKSAGLVTQSYFLQDVTLEVVWQTKQIPSQVTSFYKIK